MNSSRSICTDHIYEMRIHQNRIDAAVGVLSLTRAPKQGKSCVCSVLRVRLHRAIPPRIHKHPFGLRIIHPHGICVIPTTTVGAHRGAEWRLLDQFGRDLLQKLGDSASPLFPELELAAVSSGRHNLQQQASSTDPG